jgi:hypothetical protein
MKVRTNILIEKETLTSAQGLGLNVSKTCDNALKLYITAIQNTNPKINPTLLNECSFAKENSWCGRRDLNPGRQRGRLMS